MNPRGGKSNIAIFAGKNLNHKINLDMTNREFFINSWEREAAITSNGFRALPNDLAKLNLSHHPKLRSPWQLVNHIGPHGKELVQGITEGRVDLVNEGNFDLNAPHIYKNPEQAAKAIEENSAELINELKKVDDATWTSKMIPVYWDGNKLFDSSLIIAPWALTSQTSMALRQSKKRL